MVRKFKIWVMAFMGMRIDGERSIGTYDWNPIVELEYPEAFQQALVEVLAGDKGREKRFRYVYLGGAFTEEDQQKTLWFFSGGRRVRVCLLRLLGLFFSRY